MRNWDTAKLDALLVQIHASVLVGLDEERKNGVSDEESVSQSVGYWMYRLLDCQDGPLPETKRVIEGPLFQEAKG